VIARSALWAPATTPIEPARTRRYLRPRGYTVGLVVIALIGALLSFATDSVPQLAVAVAVLVAVVIDGFTAFRNARPLELEFATGPLVTTSDPLSCTVRGIGLRRPVVIAPAVRPNVQRFLIDGAAPGLVVLAPGRRGVVHTLLLDAVVTGPIGLVECGQRMRVPLGNSITVGPTPLPHDVVWPRPRAAHFGLSESTPIGDEVYRSVRPYVRGDSRRRVHWKASAHHGSLMVKESDGTGLVSLRIVLQLDAPGSGAEVALARAAFVAREALARGWATELVTVQPRVMPVAEPGPLGSPFRSPPVELAPALGPTHVVARAIASERAALTTLATACYGVVPIRRAAGLTLIVTSEGDRWH
jgi:uncharacterized protein (DUF58 family)